MSKNILEQHLTTIGDLNLSRDKKQAIWKKLLSHTDPGHLNFDDLERYGSMIYSMPDSALYQLNISQPVILGYMGKIFIISIYIKNQKR